jgi:hypothetical protein
MSNSLADLGETLNRVFKISERRAAIKSLAEAMAPALRSSVRVGAVVRVQPAGIRRGPARIVAIEDGSVYVKADNSATTTVHALVGFPAEWAEGLLRASLDAAYDRKADAIKAEERAEDERQTKARLRVEAFITSAFRTPMEQGRVRKALEKVYRWPILGSAPRWAEVERLAAIPTAYIRKSHDGKETYIAVPDDRGESLRVEKDITSYGLDYFRWLRSGVTPAAPTPPPAQTTAAWSGELSHSAGLNAYLIRFLSDRTARQWTPFVFHGRTLEVLDPAHNPRDRAVRDPQEPGKVYRWMPRRRRWLVSNRAAVPEPVYTRESTSEEDDFLRQDDDAMAASLMSMPRSVVLLLNLPRAGLGPKSSQYLDSIGYKHGP